MLLPTEGRILEITCFRCDLRVGEALGEYPCEPLKRFEASISKVATPRPHISYRLAKPAAIQNLQPQVLKTSTRNVEQNQEKFAKETRNQYSSVDRGKEQGMVSQGRAESHEFAHDPTEPSRVTHDQPRDRAIQVQRTRGEARIPTSKRITGPHHQPTDSTKRLWRNGSRAGSGIGGVRWRGTRGIGRGPCSCAPRACTPPWRLAAASATTTLVRPPPPLPHAEAAEEDGRAAAGGGGEDDAPGIGVRCGRNRREAAAEEVGAAVGMGRIGALSSKDGVTCDGVRLVNWLAWLVGPHAKRIGVEGPFLHVNWVDLISKQVKKYSFFQSHSIHIDMNNRI
jgi:hypothetical protein